jgi:predicted transcriptional regulator
MILIAYENHQPSTKEVQALLKITQRSVIRFRGKLVKEGYLIKDGGEFHVTDKAYPVK